MGNFHTQNTCLHEFIGIEHPKQSVRHVHNPWLKDLWCLSWIFRFIISQLRPIWKTYRILMTI